MNRISYPVPGFCPYCNSQTLNGSTTHHDLTCTICKAKWSQTTTATTRWVLVSGPVMAKGEHNDA